MICLTCASLAFFMILSYKYGPLVGIYLFVGFMVIYSFTCWYISYDYIGSRTDLKTRDGKLVIEENWGEKFLVALVQIENREKVVGTVSYKFRDSVTFRGQTKPKSVELFSLSVSADARGLGIGAQLCNAVENVAKENKCDLYLGC